LNEYKNEDYFRLGKILGYRLRKNGSVKTADIAFVLMTEIKSKAFADGIFADGEIESLTRSSINKSV
jgi:hypothetical protein